MTKMQARPELTEAYLDMLKAIGHENADRVRGILRPLGEGINSDPGGALARVRAELGITCETQLATVETYIACRNAVPDLNRQIGTDGPRISTQYRFPCEIQKRCYDDILVLTMNFIYV